MRAVIAVIAAAGVVAAPMRASATPATELERARQSFSSRDWQTAIPVLTALLYPVLQLVRQEDVVEAHVLLGAAHFETQNRKRAQEEFEKALQLEPDRSLNTLRFSDGAIRMFDDTKAELRARLERDAEKKAVAERLAAVEAYKKSLVVLEARPYYVNFIPFGAGQFQNKQRKKGMLFAAGQLLTGGASAGIFLYLASTYGLDAKVPREDSERIRRLQQIEIGTGVAFIGLYAWGVVDAMLHHKAHAQIKGDDSLLPDDLRELRTPPKPKRTSLRDRLRLGPILMPNGGAGIGLSLEND